MSERQCSANTASGEQCKLDALEDSILCGIHAKVVEVKNKPSIDFKIHWINFMGQFGQGGSWSKEAIIADLEVPVQNGYELKDTHFIGRNEEAFGVMFVYVLKA